MATYLERVLAKLTEFEGSVPWMYRDTAGHVTVGVGLMLPSAEAATALPFQVAGQAIRSEQIASEFHRVNSLPPGRAALFYRQVNSPELPSSTIEERLRSVLLDMEAALQRHLPPFASLPDPAKIALLDMAYNLGVTGLVHGYPRLLAAIRSQNWTEAAAQCLRHGISTDRNAWTRLQFLSVATVAGVITGLQAVAETLRPMLRWTVIAAGAATLAGIAIYLGRRRTTRTTTAKRR